jgi:hypothetical protein
MGSAGIKKPHQRHADGVDASRSHEARAAAGWRKTRLAILDAGGTLDYVLCHHPLPLICRCFPCHSSSALMSEPFLFFMRLTIMRSSWYPGLS